MTKRKEKGKRERRGDRIGKGREKFAIVRRKNRERERRVEPRRDRQIYNKLKLGYFLTDSTCFMFHKQRMRVGRRGSRRKEK